MAVFTPKRAKAFVRSCLGLLFVAAIVHQSQSNGRPRKLSMVVQEQTTRVEVQQQQEAQKKITKYMTVTSDNNAGGALTTTTTNPQPISVGAREQAVYMANAAQKPTSTAKVPFVEKSQRGKVVKKKRQKKIQQQLLSSSQQDTYGLPPLNTLVGDLHQNVTGDVQFLLDFAIVGFGKCGTTALINWLDDHPEINTIPKEALHLSRKRPALMVQKLYQMKLDDLKAVNDNNKEQQQEKVSTKDGSSTKDEYSSPSQQVTRPRLQGFKNPSDVRRPESMTYLRQHWPTTKLIITLRHPVHWFRSLYNFLVNEMGRKEKYLRSQPLIGGPHKNTAYAHTGKGEFHAILSLLGKTNLTDEDELELLKGFLQEDELENWPQPLPNKIFFLETTQMSDKNETRAALFRKDLQSFLGLQQELPPVLHVRPGKDRQVDESLKIDMCDPANLEIRQELMRISRKASLWIRNYFMASEDVVVSSREYVEEIFATAWMQDPCDSTVTSS